MNTHPDCISKQPLTILSCIVTSRSGREKKLHRGEENNRNDCGAISESQLATGQVIPMAQKKKNNNSNSGGGGQKKQGGSSKSGSSSSESSIAKAYSIVRSAGLVLLGVLFLIYMRHGGGVRFPGSGTLLTNVTNHNAAIQVVARFLL
eukprot:TRINITY_DN2996_c0_g1_i4.p1 TRINITY_DN2996_c0_g1~~TRINITY_DN2996_c0_g1_i4.p1  ORF type:complete len:148 (-),score=23.85 TRINITY_DN2996_c0_g1_i4:889-1332(-)